MSSQLEDLKNRILGKKRGLKETELTNLLDMVREFSCLGEVIGREFEIRDSKGKVVYTIHQKPMAVKQMNNLLKEFVVLKGLDNKREAAKWGNKDKGRLNTRRK